MELYVHIPFCVRKCKYCDFLSMPSDEATRMAYAKALEREITIRSKAFSDVTVETVYFGGGTPTVLPAELLCKLFNAIKTSFRVKEGAEITVEANPKTIDAAGLKKLYAGGFNRLSLGLQSVHDKELKLLGRIHTYEDFLDCFRAARAAGFENINVDLISSLPGQKKEAYEESLKTLISLRPTHISSYSLIIEEGTPFYEMYHDHPEKLPDEEAELAMYHMTRDVLSQNGYKRYEISNYCLPGYESRHNTGYWRRVPYLGLGLGASSFTDGKRHKNDTDITNYIKGMNEGDGEDVFFKEYEELSLKDAMAEYLFLGLRMTTGVSVAEFCRQFGKELAVVYKTEIEKLTCEGLIILDNAADRLYLTDLGLDLANYVFSEFL
ncbi:MAG: radical SAM family heme chaperone HemW [Lachnospiraceae bacterium]|nr:radical SAM family heme chaperone HemW [Lachnospiraceae bacterium]